MTPNLAAQVAKEVGDLSAFGIAAGALLKWLPPVAALFSIMWLAIRIYESLSGNDIADTKLARVLTCKDCPFSERWAQLRGLFKRKPPGGE